MNPSPPSTAAAGDLIERARRFAESAHGAIDHRRKYTGEPYTVHLQRVAAIVAEAGGDAEMVAAAWLHDTVEDTDATLADVEREFGSNVVALVRALTDVEQSAGNRRTRKAMDRERLAASGRRAQTVKLADLIDNAVDITTHDRPFARVYLKEAQALIDVMLDADEQLRTRALRTFEHCRRQLRGR